jgi:hypothetical protein
MANNPKMAISLMSNAWLDQIQGDAKKNSHTSASQGLGRASL